MPQLTNSPAWHALREHQHELAGEHMRVTGAMTGWFLAGASLGGMSLPWGIGQAFVGIGARAMPVLVLATVAVNLLVILLFLVRPVKALQTA